MNEKPEAMQLPTLPFAVFDEFGQPCEDRVRDHFAAAFEALRKDAERYRWLAWTSDTQPIVIYEIGTGQILFGNKANDVINAAMKGQP